MGISLNIETNNETEFNQQLQMYLAQGYSMQSNFNGTAILKKKSYSVGVLIVLIIFLFPIAIIYYLLASDDIVTITNNGGQAPRASATAGSPSNVSYDAYCEECGQGLFKDSKFCPGCGRDLSEVENEPVETLPVETDNVEGEAGETDTVEDEPLKCESCGTELTEEHRFCPNCGVAVNEE